MLIKPNSNRGNKYNTIYDLAIINSFYHISKSNIQEKEKIMFTISLDQLQQFHRVSKIFQQHVVE